MKPHLPYDRSVRLADQIYQIVAQVCYTGLSDPRLKGVQITQARMTKDLRIVRIFFHSLHATHDGIDVMKRALEHAKGVFKRAVGDAIPLKYMPEFEFFYDETADVVDRIDALFEEIEKRKPTES